MLHLLLIPAQMPFAVCLGSSFYQEIKSIPPGPLRLDLAICFDFTCSGQRFGSKCNEDRGLKSARALERALFFLLGSLLPSREAGLTCCVMRGVWLSHQLTRSQLPDVGRLLSPRSLSTVILVTQAILEHPPHRASLHKNRPAGPQNFKQIRMLVLSH